MAWFSRFTRFGDMHLVYAQEKDKSCGIASVMMVVFKVNKLAIGKTAVHVEDHIYKVYGQVSGSAYDGTSSTRASRLAWTLNKLNVGTWKCERLDENAVSKKIIDKVGTTSGLGPTVNVSPVILLVRWTSGGGHFVVIDTVRTIFGSHYATVCDPWDGDVHVTEFKSGEPFKYVANQVPFSWDLGGVRHDYSGEGNTTGNRYLIYRN